MEQPSKETTTRIAVTINSLAGAKKMSGVELIQRGEHAVSGSDRIKGVTDEQASASNTVNVSVHILKSPTRTNPPWLGVDHASHPGYAIAHIEEPCASNPIAHNMHMDQRQP